MRSKITKLVVYKIEILKDGFEIHFHVGEAHYLKALGDSSPSASFFVSKAFKKKKPYPGIPAEGFNFVLADSESKKKIQLCERSRRLTIGGPWPPNIDSSGCKILDTISMKLSSCRWRESVALVL